MQIAIATVLPPGVIPKTVAIIEQKKLDPVQLVQEAEILHDHHMLILANVLYVEKHSQGIGFFKDICEHTVSFLEIKSVLNFFVMEN